MRELVKSRRFEADYHQAIRSGLSADDWEHLAYLLAKHDSLPEEYGERRLTDNWERHWDCHLEGDLVVLYRRTATKAYLARIGKHAELFPQRKRPRRKRGVSGWFFGNELRMGTRVNGRGVAEANRLHGVGHGNGEMGFLIFFDEERPQLQFRGLRRTLFGVHQALDLRKRGRMLGGGFDDFGLHGAGEVMDF
jgi:mRNA interferase YafQ